MKQAYESPALDIERFAFADILTLSGTDIGTGDVGTDIGGNGSDEGFTPVG